MSSPQQQRPRRRHRSNNTSVIATTAATAAFAYGTYRLARWYCEDEDDNDEEGIQRPLEEDLSSFFSEQQPQEQQQQRRQEVEKKSNRNDATSTTSHNSSYCIGNGNGIDDNKNYSWLSSAAIGFADWLLVGGSSSSSNIAASNTNNNNQQQRSKRSMLRLTRRQLLDRCRYQTRIAFQTCFPTLKPVIEKLTDSSNQTKELKALRKYRIQKLKLQREQGHEQEIEQNQPEKNDIDSNNSDINKTCKNNGTKQREQIRKYEHELQKVRLQEEELWCEILVDTTTRMMVSSYAYALLLMSLTVQFHWLTSSQQKQQQQQPRQENQAEAMLMRSHQYLLNEGIPLLVKTVRRSVEKVLFNNDDDENFDDGITRTANNRDKDDTSSPASCWNNPSTQFVTCKEIEQVLYRRLPIVLNDVGSGSGRRNRRHRNWIRFVLPDEELFDPMWDICRSPVWEDAQEQVLECLWYRTLRDGNNNDNNHNHVNSGWGSLFQPTDGNCCDDGEGIEGIDVNVENNDRNNLQHQQRKPLAKTMAQFKKAASVLFDDVSKNKIDDNANERTTTIGKLQTLPTVLELGDVSFQ